ncbi:MAG: YqhA family protein [Thermodesulfobacteriota bacterium]
MKNVGINVFIRPEQALPSWLRVKEVGQLKQVVAELIVVIIFVLFLRVALQVFQDQHQHATKDVLIRKTCMGPQQVKI